MIRYLSRRTVVAVAGVGGAVVFASHLMEVSTPGRAIAETGTPQKEAARASVERLPSFFPNTEEPQPVRSHNLSSAVCPFQVFVPSSLLAGANFPVLGSREFEANELKRPGEFEYLDRSAQGRSKVIQRIPCIFPAEQGFRHRDEFETDWLHRH